MCVCLFASAIFGIWHVACNIYWRKITNLYLLNFSRRLLYQVQSKHWNWLTTFYSSRVRRWNSIHSKHHHHRHHLYQRFAYHWQHRNAHTFWKKVYHITSKGYLHPLSLPTDKKLDICLDLNFIRLKMVVFLWLYYVTLQSSFLLHTKDETRRTASKSIELKINTVKNRNRCSLGNQAKYNPLTNGIYVSFTRNKFKAICREKVRSWCICASLEFHPLFSEGKAEYISAINYQNRHRYVQRISFIQHNFWFLRGV